MPLRCKYGCSGEQGMEAFSSLCAFCAAAACRRANSSSRCCFTIACRCRNASFSAWENVLSSVSVNVPCSTLSQLHHQSVAGVSRWAIYAPFCLLGLAWVGQRCSLPSAMISAGISPLPFRTSRKVCRALLIVCPLLAKVLYKRVDVLGFPDSSAGADLDGLGKASGAAPLQK